MVHCLAHFGAQQNGLKDIQKEKSLHAQPAIGPRSAGKFTSEASPKFPDFSLLTTGTVENLGPLRQAVGSGYCSKTFNTFKIGTYLFAILEFD